LEFWIRQTDEQAVPIDLSFSKLERGDELRPCGGCYSENCGDAIQEADCGLVRDAIEKRGSKLFKKQVMDLRGMLFKKKEQ